MSESPKRIAIFIVAYNASNTLAKVLDRIPEAVWARVEEVFVFDDESRDDTFQIGIDYKRNSQRANLHVFRNERNQGYGGNQIRGYQYAIQRGFDIVALLHGDGQYAPEALPQLLAPLERGEADAVFGSRMAVAGAALKGGMPLYKYVGNRILTTFENSMLGMELTEFHSGYRLYSMAALKDIPFEKNTHDFHFDTQIIIQLNAANKRILEIPIPTYYGDEICHVNGMRYAKDVFLSVLQYRAHEFGLTNRPEYQVAATYNAKKSAYSSHSQLIELVPTSARRVLDLGCGEGAISRALLARGHDVVSLDSHAPQEQLPHFIQTDLTEDLPLAPHDRFDVVVLADVLEHLVTPANLLSQAMSHLTMSGSVLVSLPNVVHWSVRALVLAGKFEYTNRGILDQSHLRFFTKKSAEQLFREVGLHVKSHRTTPVPWELVFPRGLPGVAKTVERADLALTRVQPDLFAYQHLFELVPAQTSRG
jgi:glycosyltransferase involved in cell wall biosynthesis